MAGLCIAPSALHLSLFSTLDGSPYLSATSPLKDTTDISLRDSLTSLANQHPRELTVLTISSQLSTDERYRITRLAGSAALPIRHTLNHIQAYIAGIKDEELPETESCLLFLELLHTTSVAQLLVLRVQNGVHQSRIVRTVSITSPVPQQDLAHRLIQWSLSPDHPPTHLVLLDPPDPIPTNLHSAFPYTPTPCLISNASGPVLARNAAAYAFAHLTELREEEDDEMVTAIMPVPISVLSASGAVVQLIPLYDAIPALGTMLFTTVRDGQTRMSIELLLGNHARPADNYSYARVALEGIRPAPKGETRVRVTVLVTYDNGSQVVVEDVTGEDGPKAVVQIQDPFCGKAFQELKTYIDMATVKNPVPDLVRELPDYE